ncbi:MAG: tail fiber domain-containing protein [Planctomycetia bacterium]|nr:tail fiber domain-containing protein [Planctomycetia bacterium]
MFRDNTAGKVRMMVDSAGKVGIGTTTPESALSIENLGAVDDVGILGIGETNQEIFDLRADFAGGGAAGNALRMWSLWNPNVMTWRGDGNVGIGTATPAGRLDVHGGNALFSDRVGIGTSSPSYPLHIDSASSQAPLFINDTFSTPNTQSWGIWSQTANPRGTAVLGTTSTEGNPVGVQGNTHAPNGVGVGGYALSATGPGIGVFGHSASPEGHAGYFSGRCYVDGNMGIGVTAPTARLHTVGGPTFSQVRFEDANPLGIWVNLLNTDAGGREFGLISTGSSNGEGAGALLIRDNTAGIVRMMVDPAGNVGIGTIAPTEALDVVGNIRATGSVFAACGTLSCSDERFKTNIEPVADALTVVEKLQPVHYDWKRDEFPERHFSKDRQVGLIAQDVRKVAPEVVRQDEEGYLAVDYGRLTPLIVSAIKQVKSEKDDQIASLHAENAALKARLDRLESMLGKAAK